MRHFLIASLVVVGFAATAPAAVVVLANFTPDEIKVTITSHDKKTRTVAFAPVQVLSIPVAGPCEALIPAKPDAAYQLDPYHAYVIVPDPKLGRRLQGIEMPGDPRADDAKPDPIFAPREPVKIPVTLMVDDADPRADALWQKTLRARFDEAAAVIEAHADVKLAFAGFDTWNSVESRDMSDLLGDFTAKVKVKGGAIAVGYTSRIKIDPKDPPDLIPYGASLGVPTRHVLLREGAPRSDPEKVEALIHHLGLALGAVPTPDPESVMRPRIADGLALHPKYRFRLDPLNVLAMNLWADELRRGAPAKIADITPANKARLARVYGALLKAKPGDTLATTYLESLDRDLAVKPPPAVLKKEVDPSRNPSVRDEVATRVLRAVIERARANTGPGAVAGDDLTAAYVRAAATEARIEAGNKADYYDRMSGFMLGLGIALDDTDALRNEPLTADTVKLIEADFDRIDRLKVLGNPTIRGRRDLCRRFAIGCGNGELLRGREAEELAFERSFSRSATAKVSGVSFPALAAELAGIAFSNSDPNASDPLKRHSEKFIASDFLPLLDGFREGIPGDRFREEYGDVGDPRLEKVLADIREQVKKK